MSSNIAKLLDVFNSKINTSNEYSLKDLTKILDETYKETYGGKSKKSIGGEKKPPSQYNLFIKDEIAKIKNENLTDVEPKDFMKIAAGRWKSYKETLE